jgi:hypothetical protein
MDQMARESSSVLFNAAVVVARGETELSLD